MYTFFSNELLLCWHCIYADSLGPWHFTFSICITYSLTDSQSVYCIINLLKLPVDSIGRGLFLVMVQAPFFLFVEEFKTALGTLERTLYHM